MIGNGGWGDKKSVGNGKKEHKKTN